VSEPTITVSTDADEKRCTRCHQLCYLDGRPPGIYRHYITDSEFCYPHLSVTEAFGSVATPGPK